MPRRLPWRILAVVFIFTAAGAAAFFWYRERSSGASDVQIETAAVDRGTISAQVTATGTLSPRKLVTVSSQVSGRIDELKVDYNDHVAKGQVLAVIDRQVVGAQLEQAEASLAAAEATLEHSVVARTDAERTFTREEALHAQSLVSQADYDSALAKRDLARADVRTQEAIVRQARAAVKQARANITYTTIVSPVDGVVISRSINVGQTVAAALQAPTLFTIAEDLARMQLDTSVAEGDVGRLVPGMKVRFSVDAYPERDFDGVVRQIRNDATTVQNVVTYDAVIDVENRDGALRPGMTATVTFVIEEIANAIRVPNSALRFKPSIDQLQAIMGPPPSGGPPSGGPPSGAPPTGGFPGGGPPGAGAPGGGASNAKAQPIVWKLVNGAARPVLVKVGLSDGSYTQLVQGDLRAGDELVTDVIGAPKAKLKLPGAF